MATSGVGTPPVKKKRAREHHLTVMIMGKLGKVRSFRVSRRLLFWAFLFFAAYLPFSAYLVNRYFELTHLNKSHQEKLALLEKDLSRSANALSRSKEHILFIEEYILEIENQAQQAPGPASTPARREGDLAASPRDTRAPHREEAIVAVEDLELAKLGNFLEVQFKIVSLLSEDTSVAGYVHLRAKAEEGLSRPEWVYPQVRWVEGFPENFKRGQMFLIRRFKPMEGVLPVGSGPDAPTMLEILVYDQAGKIILKEEYQIP